MLSENMLWDPLPKHVRRESEEAAMMTTVRDVCLHLYETFAALWGDLKGLDFRPVFMLAENIFGESSPKQARTQSEKAAMMAAVRDVCLQLYETFAAICADSDSPVRVTFSTLRRL